MMQKSRIGVAHTLGACLILLMVAGSDTFAAPEKNGFNLEGAAVPISEIRRGGPPRDGIPALNYPKSEAGKSASWLRDEDRVLGVAFAGHARAYPIKILNAHEVVNDHFEERYFFAVTFCPLCGSGMVFNSVHEGSVRVFGVSGLLYNSDVLLYDRNTESLWSQLKRAAISGVEKGKKLTLVPALHTTWGAWRNRHPDSQVLSLDTGYRRVYKSYRNNPYADYVRTSRLMFPVAEKNRALPNKAWVLGVELDNKFKAYPFKQLAKMPAEFNDSIGEQRVVIRHDKTARSAEVFLASGPQAGQPIPSVSAYWFAWYGFHPDTELLAEPVD